MSKNRLAMTRKIWFIRLQRYLLQFELMSNIPSYTVWVSFQYEATSPVHAQPVPRPCRLPKYHGELVQNMPSACASILVHAQRVDRNKRHWATPNAALTPANRILRGRKFHDMCSRELLETHGMQDIGSENPRAGIRVGPKVRRDCAEP